MQWWRRARHSVEVAQWGSVVCEYVYRPVYGLQAGNQLHVKKATILFLIDLRESEDCFDGVGEIAFSMDHMF